MHSWISVSGSLLVSPVRMLRVQPLVLIWVQEKQMPMRQPYSGVSPAASACSSSVAPVLSALVPARAKVTVPVGVVGDGGERRRELLDVQAIDQAERLVVLAHRRASVRAARTGTSRRRRATARRRRGAPGRRTRSARRRRRRCRRGRARTLSCAAASARSSARMRDVGRGVARSAGTRPRRRSPRRTACAASTAPA